MNEVSGAVLSAANDFVKEIEENERKRFQEAHTSEILHNRLLKEFSELRSRYERKNSVPSYIQDMLEEKERKIRQYQQDFQKTHPLEGLPVKELNLKDSPQENWPIVATEIAALSSETLPPLHLKQDRPHPSIVCAVDGEDIEVFSDEIVFLE